MADTEQATLLNGAEANVQDGLDFKTAARANWVRDAIAIASLSQKNRLPISQLKVRNLVVTASVFAAVLGCIALRRATVGSNIVDDIAAAQRIDDGLPPLEHIKDLPDDDLERSAQLFTTSRSSNGPMTMTFYMYRAQSLADYALQNVNAADLPGVMWYLHNEVVGASPRKYGITRIIRYKVTMRSQDKLYKLTHAQFGPYVAFDSGRCTVPDCDTIWNTYGFNIGCQMLNASMNAYVSPFTTRLSGKDCPPHCSDPLWYSLPGPCPSLNNDDKNPDCTLRMPGGMCNDVHLLSRPGVACTYFIEKAGEVSLDELVGIENYTKFWADDHYREYDWKLDRGIGNDFWDKRHDVGACTVRTNKVQELFKKRYPNLPTTYGEPPCDAS